MRQHARHVYLLGLVGADRESLESDLDFLSASRIAVYIRYVSTALAALVIAAPRRASRITVGVAAYELSDTLASVDMPERGVNSSEALDIRNADGGIFARCDTKLTVRAEDGGVSRFLRDPAREGIGIKCIREE